MNSFFRLLKKFQLDELLLGIGNITRNMFNDHIAVINLPVTRYKPVRTQIGTKILQQSGKVTVSSWSLLEISYNSIQQTNDFADNSPTFDNIVEICSEYIGYENEQSSKIYKGKTSQKRILFDLFGLAQKEFWFQELHTIREQFNRDVELLEIIPNQIENALDLNVILKEITGFTIKSFRKLLLSIFAMGMQNSNLSTIRIDESTSKFDKTFTKDNIFSVIRSYAAEYQECRTSPFRHGFFYSKPIIHTTKNKYIVVNQFLVAKKISDCVFWKLRDHFATKSENESRRFTKQFGRLFEKYVENLFNYYLNEDQFERIPEGSEERADWIINTSRYQIIVEQKSSLMSLMLKDIHVDLDRFDEYLLRLKKGIVQLDKTSLIYKNSAKNTIKFLLIYDQLHMCENILKEQLLAMSAVDLSNNKNYFLIHIGDFEHIIQILSENEYTFDKIIENKLQLEEKPSPEGKDFDQVIRKHYEKGNLYIHKHLNHYEKYFDRSSKIIDQD